LARVGERMQNEREREREREGGGFEREGSDERKSLGKGE